MKTYVVSFSIDVDEKNTQEACKHAWEILTNPNALLPVGIVREWGSDKEERIDLQAIHENE